MTIALPAVLAEIDEAFDDVDDRREQAMLPAMITRPEAQLLVVSTMGTDASTYLNRKVEAGRAAALEGRTSGIAYFEYSIPLDEDVDDALADPLDPVVPVFDLPGVAAGASATARVARSNRRRLPSTR